jgi:PEP-CTERM motif
MKKNLLLTLFVLGSFATFSAQAQIAPVGGSGNGELFLGFQNQTGSGIGAATDVVVDLGAYNNFLNQGSTINETGFASLITRLTPGMNAVYGAGWMTNGNISWGIIGRVNPATNGDTINTIYASVLSGNAAWSRASSAAQGTINSKVASFESQYQTDYNNSQFTTGGIAGGTNGGIVMGTTENNSWTSYDTYLGTSFGSFNGGIDALTTQSLDLYKLPWGSGAGTLLTTLSLTAVVPEPSSYALMGLSTLVIGGYVLRRRQSSKA